MRLVSLAAAMIATCVCTQAASAQLPQLSKADEAAILCISDSLSDDDALTVAIAEIEGDAKSVEASSKAMAKGAAACKDRLKGDKQRVELAQVVAVEQAIIDVAVAQLQADGMKGDGGGVFDLWGALPRKDQDYILDEKAPDDEAFRARMKPLLVKAGVPDKEQDIDGGLLLMESLSYMASYYREWLALDADTTR